MYKRHTCWIVNYIDRNIYKLTWASLVAKNPSKLLKPQQNLAKLASQYIALYTVDNQGDVHYRWQPDFHIVFFT